MTATHRFAGTLIRHHLYVVVARVFERTFSYGFTVDARQCHKCHRLVAENLIHCGIDLRTNLRSDFHRAATFMCRVVKD